MTPAARRSPSPIARRTPRRAWLPGAGEIISRAREHGVYVHESPELVSLLMQVDLDEHIPPQLYRAVAELLAWLYRLDQGGETPPP